MHFIGLTGGIATGKSTVTELLRKQGLPVLDADQIAREVVEPGQPALREIAERFPGVVKDGVLDRAALGKRVFGNDDERQALNAITHPRIQERTLELTQKLFSQGEKVVLYDAALLIENRLHQAMNGVVLVVAPPEVQKARLMARNGFSSDEADARIRSQLPLEEKKKFATWIIDNGGTLEQTQAQVAALAATLKGL